MARTKKGTQYPKVRSWKGTLQRRCFRCGRTFGRTFDSQYCSDTCRLGIEDAPPRARLESSPRQAPEPKVTVVTAPLRQCQFCSCWVKEGHMARHLSDACPDRPATQNELASGRDFRPDFGDIPIARLSFRLLPPGTWDIAQVDATANPSFQQGLQSR